MFEHPLTSQAWHDSQLRNFIEKDDIYLAKSDQCMYGLKDLSGKPYKKPTGWATNVKEIAERLSRRCDGSHRHELVLGSNQGGSRAAQAQHYPDQLIDEILNEYTDYLGDEQKVNYVEYPAILRQIETEQQREQRVGREVLAVEEIEPRSQDEPMVGNQGRPDDMPDIEESIKRLPRERAFSMEHLVRRAHEGLGHPGNDRLARILKSAGARKEAVDYAKQLQCAVCDQHRKTRAPRQAAPPRELHVNSIVGADTVYLPTWDKKTRPALNIVLLGIEVSACRTAVRTQSRSSTASLSAVDQVSRPTREALRGLGQGVRTPFQPRRRRRCNPHRTISSRDAYAEVNHGTSRQELQGSI